MEDVSSSAFTVPDDAESPHQTKVLHHSWVRGMGANIEDGSFRVLWDCFALGTWIRTAAYYIFSDGKRSLAKRANFLAGVVK